MEKRKVKFGMVADVHILEVPYANEMLAQFLEACRKENVDFIIELGDFCPPTARDINPNAEMRPDFVKQWEFANVRKGMEMWKNFEKPAYHVLGNHEHDFTNKQEVFEFYKEEYKPYYSFDHGGFHFIVLDNNYYYDHETGETVPYDKKNYCRGGEKTLQYLPKEELEWLKEDLAKTKNPSFLFAHNQFDPLGSYIVDKKYIENCDELDEILRSAPSGVYICFTGHTHRELLYRKGNIWHYTMNCMNNVWVGENFDLPPQYSQEVRDIFPYSKHQILFKDALYAIVEMDENGAMITGSQSSYAGVSPEESGIYTRKNSHWNKKNIPIIIQPWVTSRYINFLK